VTVASSERLAERIAEIAADRKARDIRVLDVGSLVGYTDYFLICSGKSTTHLETITDAIRAELRGEGVNVLHAEGLAESGWVLLDYGDVLMHVFLEDTRLYYALERLWGDAPTLALEDS